MLLEQMVRAKVRTDGATFILEPEFEWEQRLGYTQRLLNPRLQSSELLVNTVGTWFLSF